MMELQTSFVRGDPLAFEALVRETRPALGSFLRRLVPSEHDAEDLVQETYLRAYQHRARWDSRASLKTWVYSIALNLARDRARRSGARKAREGARPGAAPHDGGPERSELAERVREIVRSLPEGQREIFILYRYQALPYDEIATALGISTGAVKAQMHHALKKVRSELMRLGYKA